MNKVVITLTTDKDLLSINRHMNIMIEAFIKQGVQVTEYTIQEFKSDPAVFSSLDDLIATDNG